MLWFSMDEALQPTADYLREHTVVPFRSGQS